jgi:hypothetical protein
MTKVPNWGVNRVLEQFAEYREAARAVADKELASFGSQWPFATSVEHRDIWNPKDSQYGKPYQRFNKEFLAWCRENGLRAHTELPGQYPAGSPAAELIYHLVWGDRAGMQ